MAARTKGFARKLAAERLAESLGVDAPAQGVPVKAVTLRLSPLVAPYRSKGLYALRIERVPQLARLSRGRNNGNGSWSLTPEEADGVEYIGPDSALERPSLALRLLDNDGGTLALLELPLDAAEAESLSRETTVDNEYLRKLTDELASARAALAEREKEISDLRRHPRADGDVERRLAAADAAAQMAADQAKKLWQDEERSRFAAAEARWREQSDRALADAQAKAAAALVDAERGWKDRLAAAEAKARDHAAVADAGKARDADLQRLRDQVAGLEATLKRRDDEFALLRRDATSAQQRGKDDLAAAERRWKDDEARRLAAAEKDWQAKSADEIKRLTARLDTAERALAGNRDAQTARDGELRTLREAHAARETELRTLRDERAALQARLDSAERTLAGTRDAQSSRDSELRTLGDALAAREAELRAQRDERITLQTKLAAAEAAPKGVGQDAVRQQIETALAAAKMQWETDAAARIAQAEAAVRAEAAAAPKGLSQDAVNRQIETALAAAKSEWQTTEADRIARAEQRVRAEIAAAAPAAATGLSPNAVQQQVETALDAAKAEWKSEEAGRLALAEEKWRNDLAPTLARLTKRAETAEASLVQLQSAPPPPVAAAPIAPFDQGLIDSLHHEISELRKALSDREVETAQLKMTLETRQAIPEPKVSRFYPEPRQIPEREMRIHDPRRSTGKLIKEVLIVFGVIAFLAVGFPFVVPYLPYDMQDQIAEIQASMFGSAPAPDSGAPAAKPVKAAAAAPIGTPATIARSVNLRATASASAAVVTRLKKGDAVVVVEASGSWTHIKTANFEGWVFSSYLKK